MKMPLSDVQKMTLLFRDAKAKLKMDLNAANDLIDRLETAKVELEHQVAAFNEKVLLLEAANPKLKSQLNESNDTISSRETENMDLLVQIIELQDTVDNQVSLIRSYRHLEEENEGGLVGDEPTDMHRNNSDEIPDFSMGYVGGETWGTNYGLEDTFNVENEKVDEGGDGLST